jgi:SAM-dependent methyltransferase
MASNGYYSTTRTDLLDWWGGGARRVLDVGCGEGANAAWLRAHGADWVEGVEPHLPSAEVASMALDRLHACPVEDAELDGLFDLIICADVLEHTVDPEGVLGKLRDRITDNGRLLVSVPNIRHYRALARIAFGPAFQPEPSGTFDGTHLRFFTRGNLADRLRAAGWGPVRWGYPSFSRPGRTVRPLLARLTRGLTDEWLVGQWFVSAQPL